MLSDFGLNFDESAYWQEPDFLLADIVSAMANKAGIQLGITLMVSGTVITGLLISEREYLATISTVFTTQAKNSIQSPSKEDLEAIEDIFNFNVLAEDTYPDLEEDVDEADDDFEDDSDVPAPVRHLHLKEPTILLPEPSITFTQGEVPMMRIRLAAVDGWILGRIQILGADDLDEPPQILH